MDKNNKVFGNEKYLNRLFIVGIILICIRAIFDIVFIEQFAAGNMNKQTIVTPIPAATSTLTPTSTPTSTPSPTPTVEPDPIIKEYTEEPVEPSPVETGLIHILNSLKEKRKKLYADFTDEELNLLFLVVEAEVTGGDIESKSHVASVIFNRIKSGWHDGNLTENLMAKQQFKVVTNGRYKKMEITEDTVIACELAYVHDTAQGALFFDSTNGKSWAAKNLEFVFRDKVGHDFFR